MIQKTRRNAVPTVYAPSKQSDTNKKAPTRRQRKRRRKKRLLVFPAEWFAVLTGISACILILCFLLSPKQEVSAHTPKADVLPIRMQVIDPAAKEAKPRPQEAEFQADAPPEEPGFAAPVMAWQNHISSAYGNRENPTAAGEENHKGIDIAMPAGTPIYAAQSGEVLLADDTANGYGKHVVVMHDDVITTLYGHCSELLVSAGQQVSRGEVIALVGSTGNSTGPHVHFEVRENGKAVDPAPFLNESAVKKPEDRN